MTSETGKTSKSEIGVSEPTRAVTFETGISIRDFVKFVMPYLFRFDSLTVLGSILCDPSSWVFTFRN